jgi:predicted nucleotidyltransferase
MKYLDNGKGELLNFFFKNPDGAYYFREIAKNLNKEPAHYQRHLDKLVDDGILEDERKGNLRFFKLNKNHPLYEELKSIVSKTLGIEHGLKHMISEIENIDAALIFGSIAKNNESANSDIDLMIIGNPNQDILTEKIVELENKLKREINYHIYSKEEVIKNLKEQNIFFISLFNHQIIILKGNIDEYTNIAKS